MKDKILTKEEKEFIEKEVKHYLSPLKVEIKISDDYVVSHWWSEANNEPRQEWDDYLYTIKVKSDKKDYEFVESFFEYDVITDKSIAWNLAWKIFYKLDNNINSPVVKNLWPPEYGGRPDYLNNND